MNIKLLVTSSFVFLSIMACALIYRLNQDEIKAAYGSVKSQGGTETPRVTDPPKVSPTTSQTPTPTSKVTTNILNKEFMVTSSDAFGQKIGDVKFIVTDVQRSGELTNSGMVANAVEGREFLILTISLTNTIDQPIDVSSRNYIELSTDNDEIWRKADIHNDPVELQPQETKYIKLGFPINTSDSTLNLRVNDSEGKLEIFKI